MRKRSTAPAATEPSTRFSCTVCGKSFGSRRILSIHDARTHRNPGRSPEQKRSKRSIPDFAGNATDADVLIPGNEAEPFDEPPPAPPDVEQPSDAAIAGDERGLIEDHEAAQYQFFSLQRSSDAHKLVFRQQDLPQQQTHSLSRSALELLPFLCEHSAEYANGLLRVLKDPSFDLASVHWTSSKEMHKCLDQAQASDCGAHDSLYIPLCLSSIAIVLWTNMQVWEYLPVYQEDLPGHNTPVTFFANMRKDRHTLLQDMINSPEVALQQKGHRSEKATATEQANLFKLLPVALFVLPQVSSVFGPVMQGMHQAHMTFS